MDQPKRIRQKAVGDHKRTMILNAAREIFEAEGLEGASLRAIAARAGYTPQAMYFHFDSKEALYAEVLQDSLSALAQQILQRIQGLADPVERFEAAAMAFFEFYAANPRDLDLGFYLLRGGMKPAGLGSDRDVRLNAGLELALKPIASAAEDLGSDLVQAKLLVADVFAHATGLLLLLHTGRIRMFGATAQDRMQVYIDSCITLLRAK